MHRWFYGLIIVALAIVAVGAWLLPESALGPARPVAQAGAEIDAPARDLRPRQDTAYAALVQRPPFAANRRAIASVEGGDENLILGRYRLSGVIVSPDRRLVILSTPGGASQSVAEGEQIDGWTVEEITASRVTLASDGRRQEISVESQDR
jgi:hypothetical protein